MSMFTPPLQRSNATSASASATDVPPPSRLTVRSILTDLFESLQRLSDCDVVDVDQLISDDSLRLTLQIRLPKHVVAAITDSERTDVRRPAPLPFAFTYPFQHSHCHREMSGHMMSRLLPPSSWYHICGRRRDDVIPTFEQKVCIAGQSWVADHVVQGAVVYPAAAYLVSAMESVGSAVVTDIKIVRAMILSQETTEYRTVRTVCEDGAVKVYSKADQWDGGEWTLHCSSKPPSNSHSTLTLPPWCDGIIQRCNTAIPPRSLYERFKSVGLSYGPAFQRVESITVGDYESVGVVRADSHWTHPKYIHPALLDSMFHVILASVRYLCTALVPTSIANVTWNRSKPTAAESYTVYARSRVTHASYTTIIGDLYIVDNDNGDVVGFVGGMQCSAVGLMEVAQPSFRILWQTYAAPTMTFDKSSKWSLIPTDINQRYERELDALCLQYMMRALRQIDGDIVKTWPTHRQRYVQWMEHCVKSQSASTDGTHLPLSNGASDDLFAIERRALTLIGDSLPSLLSDPALLHERLFADGNTIMADLYNRAITFAPFTSIIADALVQYITDNPNRVITIVELGAGTGGLTRAVLDQLSTLPASQWRGRLHYYFTDVSPKFLHDAKTTFADYDFIDYVLLDLETDVSAWNIPAFSVDIVVAFDVVHVSRHVKTVLAKLQTLLVSNGILLLLELTRPWMWTSLFFGLFKEWFGYEDDRQIQCTMTQTQWIHRLREVGYECITTATDDQSKEFCHSVIVAHSPQLSFHTEIVVNGHNTIANGHTNGHAIMNGHNEARSDDDVTSSNDDDFPLVTTDISAVKKRSCLPIVKQPATILPSYMFDCEDIGHDIRHLLSQSQLLIKQTDAIEFWLITTLSQSIPFTQAHVNELQTIPDPQHALHIGFTRVLANESSQHTVCMIDFDSTVSETKRKEWIQSIRRWQRLGFSERELVVRDGQVFVPKLIREVPPELIKSALPTSTPFRLEIDSIGAIDSLSYRAIHTSKQTQLPPYKSTEMVVEVHAAALNFKDVMLALGMLNNPLQLDDRAVKYDQVSIGLEFSGVVVAVGSDVRGFALDDKVFGIGRDTIASHTVADYRLCARCPPQLTHSECASLPIVFCTAFAGMIDKGRLSADEFVLIHSAAGGIGQAAIQLALNVGAKVIATVGNSQKRSYLTERYGVTHFSNSHNEAEWSADVESIMGGRGVNMVVNSLKGSAIERGIKCLTIGGRFVEIGKVDILSNRALRMSALLNDIAIHSVQLDVVMANQQMERMSSYMQAITALALQGRITPIVDRVYAADDVTSAFRYLISGHHAGKVVIDMTQKQSLTVRSSLKPCHKETTYLISGGCGALGLRLLTALSQSGGRFFQLLTRRTEAAIKQSDRAVIQDCRAMGVAVDVATADVSNVDDVLANYARIVQNGYPRRVTLLHLAMILDDTPIVAMTEEKLDGVTQCKVAGIDALTAVFPPAITDGVVMFSSAASTFGNPSQSNYSAANAYLDAMTYTLTARGYRAATINFGVIEDVGVVAEDWKMRAVINAKGFTGGLTAHGVAHVVVRALSHIEQTNTPQHILHGAFDFSHIADAFPILSSRVRHLIQRQNGASSASDDSERSVSVESLRLMCASLLGVNATSIDVNESLSRQGVDSLLAVELSAKLKKSFNLAISQMELLGGISIQNILRRWEKTPQTTVGKNE